MAAVLIIALLVAVLPAQASENRVNYGDECGDLTPAECEAEKKKKQQKRAIELPPEGVAAWAAAHKINGLAPDHWAAPLLVSLVESEVLVVPDGTHLDLDKPVTLWQAAQAMMAMTKQPAEGLSSREIALRAAEVGLIPGPVPAADRPVTRLDAAYMAGRLTDFPGAAAQRVELSQVFADWEAIPSESRELVYWVSIENRLFVGYPDRTFRPAEPLTLGQFAAVMQRLRSAWASPVPELQGG